MDDTRFDTRTRRQVGLASGGLLAALLGLAGTRDQATAGHKRHQHQRRCKSLGETCTQSGKRTCCGKLHCGPIPEFAAVPTVTANGVVVSDVCCQPGGGSCRPGKKDCCEPFGCAPATKRCEL